MSACFSPSPGLRQLLIISGPGFVVFVVVVVVVVVVVFYSLRDFFIVWGMVGPLGATEPLLEVQTEVSDSRAGLQAHAQPVFYWLLRIHPRNARPMLFVFIPLASCRFLKGATLLLPSWHCPCLLSRQPECALPFLTLPHLHAVGDGSFSLGEVRCGQQRLLVSP